MPESPGPGPQVAPASVFEVGGGGPDHGERAAGRCTCDRALAIGQHDGIFLDTAAGASQPHIRRLFICPAMGGELQAGVFARGPSDRRRLPATRVMSKEPSRKCCISEFLSLEMTISEIRASGSSSPPSAKIGRPPRSLFRNQIMVYSMNSSPMVAVPFRGGSRAQRR